MQVFQAREIARNWIDAQVAGGAQIEAAFLHGSITWLERTAELSPASDVDILVVPHSALELPTRGKQVVQGLSLDVSTIHRSELEPLERLLSAYHLAGSLRSSESILYDQYQRLSALQQAVALEFDLPEWVRLRCAHAVGRIQENLVWLTTAESPEERMIAWLFAAGVSTHVLLVAGLRNPTVRNRYAAVRMMLDDLGHPEMYPTLVDLVDPGLTSGGDVLVLIDNLEPLFDLAVQEKRTSFHFSDDISSSGRIGAIDSARDLVRTGNPRDALFWIGVTAARCMTILHADGTATEQARHQPFLDDLTRLFGLESPAGIAALTQSLQDLLPVLIANSETLICEHIR